ncbi:MAG: hypothetical protein PWQ88_1180 [Candidatus Methanomethylophilaceae archaeon]|nr:hypothetical protein [Candidatus Methanomethylophilaceae archaeon]
MERIPICKPAMDEEMIAAASDALRNEALVNGESVFKFEEEFAQFIGTKYAVSVSSGTDALILSLIAAGVKGSEVVTTPFTFIASANAVLHAGGRPVLADIWEDCNLSPFETRRAITESTKALLPVHIFGRPCEMDDFKGIAEENNLIIVEDACQAHGASYREKKVGAIGEIGCFSFYPTKNMTVGGDGGMVTTDNEDIAMTVRKLRDCGRRERYLHDAHGFTSRLNTVNAAIGRVQLKRLDAWNASRIRNAQLYARLLKDMGDIVLPPMNDDKVKGVFHLFAVRTSYRNDLQTYLNEKGIATAIHYPLPVHKQPAFDGYFEGVYPVSERVSQQTISLPMFPSLSEEEVRTVCESIGDFFRKTT